MREKGDRRQRRNPEYPWCRFRRWYSLQTDGCVNEWSQNRGQYEAGAKPSLSEICRDCPDYLPAKDIGE